MDVEKLKAFEGEIVALFERGMIRAPVHLCGGNEEELIRIFKHISPDDWVFSTHRSHIHALLKGIPPEWLKTEILKGHSITLNNAEHRFFSSAIVGGTLPIALGVAMSGQRVYCFVGDMAAETGIFHECVKYAHGHQLPIMFVIEDNGLSVLTPTENVWQGSHNDRPNVYRYFYKNEYKHQGTGVHVVF